VNFQGGAGGGENLVPGCLDALGVGDLGRRVGCEVVLDVDYEKGGCHVGKVVLRRMKIEDFRQVAWGSFR
jgi:hypothetical protein